MDAIVHFSSAQFRFRSGPGCISLAVMMGDRTKLLRGVLAFLAGCAVLGFAMGLRGAIPAAESDYDADAPLSTTSGVVVDAAPVVDTAPPAVEQPPAEEEATDEEAPAEEKKAEAPTPPPPAATRPAPPPVPEPKEEPPPADPVGDIIAPPPPSALNNLY